MKRFNVITLVAGLMVTGCAIGMDSKSIEITALAKEIFGKIAPVFEKTKQGVEEMFNNASTTQDQLLALQHAIDLTLSHQSEKKKFQAQIDALKAAEQTKQIDALAADIWEKFDPQKPLAKGKVKMQFTSARGTKAKLNVLRNMIENKLFIDRNNADGYRKRIDALSAPKTNPTSVTEAINNLATDIFAAISAHSCEHEKQAKTLFDAATTPADKLKQLHASVVLEYEVEESGERYLPGHEEFLVTILALQKVIKTIPTTPPTVPTTLPTPTASTATTSPAPVDSKTTNPVVTTPIATPALSTTPTTPSDSKKATTFSRKPLFIGLAMLSALTGFILYFRKQETMKKSDDTDAELDEDILSVS